MNPITQKRNSNINYGQNLRPNTNTMANVKAKTHPNANPYPGKNLTLNANPSSGSQLQQHLDKKYFFRKNSKLNLGKHCFIYIRQTLNNTFITVRNKSKKLLLSKSCGTIGFKGPKRTTHYASGELAKNVKVTLRKNFAKRTATVILLSRITKHSKLAIKNLSQQFGLKILEVAERIPIPHNGLRKPHVRRK